VFLRLVSVAAVSFLLHAQPSAKSEFRSESALVLRLPGGWRAQDHVNGVLLMPPGVQIDPSSANNTEVYLAVTQQGYDPQEEVQFAEQISSAFLQNGVETAGVRKETLPGSRGGSVYTWDLRDPASGRNISLQIHVLPAGSRVFGVLAFGESDRVRNNSAALKQIASTMTYAAPVVTPGGPLADDTPLAQRWLQKLRGKVVKQFIGGGGAAGQKTLHLRSDGTWTYRSSVAIAADVPGVSASSTSRNAASGRWRIHERNGHVVLQLTTDSGESELLTLTDDGRQWYLNGDKAFAVDP
jgi:hypothetical protein